MNRILIAGIGNIFLGDDGFGVEVARQLAHQKLPDEVVVLDLGIRSYDLAYALTGGYEAAVLVDAVPRGLLPGTVSLIQPDLDQLHRPENGAGEAHTMDAASVVQMARSLGGAPAQIFLLGCEPAILECADGNFSLSPPVQAAVPTAIEMIETLVDGILHETLTAPAGLVHAGNENHEYWQNH